MNNGKGSYISKFWTETEIVVTKKNLFSQNTEIRCIKEWHFHEAASLNDLKHNSTLSIEWEKYRIEKNRLIAF